MAFARIGWPAAGRLVLLVRGAGAAAPDDTAVANEDAAAPFALGRATGVAQPPAVGAPEPEELGGCKLGAVDRELPGVSACHDASVQDGRREPAARERQHLLARSGGGPARVREPRVMRWARLQREVCCKRSGLDVAVLSARHPSTHQSQRDEHSECPRSPHRRIGSVKLALAADPRHAAIQYPDATNRRPAGAPPCQSHSPP